MSPKHRIPRLLILVTVCFGLFVVTLPAIFWYRLEYLEVCPRCAQVRDVQEWLIPFTRESYYKYYQLKETSLFNAITDLQLVDAHEHEWLQTAGHGPGFKEIRGEGFGISQGLTGSSVGEFVRLLNRYSDEEAMAYWFARITRPEHSYVVRNVADQCVGRSYENAEAFNNYLNEVSERELSQQRFRLGQNIHEPEPRTPPRLLY
jgi:hypothetical protein